MTTNQPDLEAIQKRCDAATKGEWKREGREILGRAANAVWASICELVRGGSPAEADANAEFIAAAKQDIPALITALKDARRERDEAQKDNEEWECTFDLTHAAEMRAVHHWRAQDPEGRRLKLPDVEGLSIWLFERIETLTKERDNYQESVRNMAIVAQDHLKELDQLRAENAALKAKAEALRVELETVRANRDMLPSKNG